MPIETRTNSALFRRAEQLKRWEDSETNNVPASVPSDKKSKIQFSDGCVFLAACAASDTEEVERLIKQGTDINTANVDGLTALHQACIDNNLEMVQFLVEHGCDVNRGDNEGWTPLHATASCGFLSIAKYLIEHKANVAAVNNDGDLPIDIAESTEMEEYLSDVLDAKEIDCDEARSEEERIMLEDAKLMLTSTVDINEKVHPRTGATPLHVAAAKGYNEVLKILIQAGADLNAQDNDGWTSLHAAAHWCQKEACAVLADNLANMDIQNFAGQTCFDVADPDIVKLLEELKKKQASMQKDRPEIQAILQRTSTRPPLKRRTSVTRMSGQEKSKSVMKDTKAERAQIENLTLREEENEEEKGKPAKNDVIEPLVKKEPDIEKIPSWKKVLRRSAEESANIDSNVPEVTLKRPKKLDDKNDKDEDNLNKDGLKITEIPSSNPSLPIIDPDSDICSVPSIPPSLCDLSECMSKEKCFNERNSESCSVSATPSTLSDVTENQLADKQSKITEIPSSNPSLPIIDLNSDISSVSSIPPFLCELSECMSKEKWLKIKQIFSPPPSHPSNEPNSESSTVPTISSALSDVTENQLAEKWRPTIPPVRDDESELQRKAHAKRVRETRRSTQGVLLEDIKSAELQYLINTQQEAAVRQAEEAQKEKSEFSSNKNEDFSVDTHDGPSKTNSKHGPGGDSKEGNDSHSTKVEKSIVGSKLEGVGKTSGTNSDAPSVTLVLRPKSTSSPEDTSPSDGRTSLGTQAAIQRRRRPKRRSTGVVYLDSDDAQEEKENASDKDANTAVESGQSERSRHRYGSSTSLPDSEASSKSDNSSRYSSRVSINEDDNKEYKKLYEEVKKENERLKEEFKKCEDELEKAKRQIQKLSQTSSVKNSLSETEKKEKRSLERKLSEMEEEIKQNEKLIADNKRLKEENAALIRVISKLSQ